MLHFLDSNIKINKIFFRNPLREVERKVFTGFQDVGDLNVSFKPLSCCFFFLKHCR